ncbi:MAG: peptide chain release factor N(5)-glutamine methyltransferase [Rhizobiales bacterium]|jgi:release factor glutamine methyltransferase|nr:peptide chain release factor N(5)-glutamine methyltransferase [Hyphomicrobiales bacterium]
MPADAWDLLTRGTTAAQARRALADAFRAAGLDTPELDARVLVGHALGLDHTGLTLAGERKLDGDEARMVSALAVRRLAREPVARILGVREFWGLPLHLNAATLVPRPETETVVEAALVAIDEDGARTRALRIADLGTGSGALLIALLSELPNASGIGTDVSPEALAAARANAGRSGVLPRARFAACDFGSALDGGYDLVVSNPPYIASGDLAALPPEVRHDPRRALDGGADGFDCYRAIAAQAPRLLKHRGLLVAELGVGQAPAVAELFRAAGLVTSPARADLAGIPRALHARLP